MHAGRGIVHSEMNLDPDETVHLLQIWLEPSQAGMDPGHEELDFTLAPGEPTVLVSPEGEAGGLAIGQDATVSALALEPGQTFDWRVRADRQGWLQWTRGEGRVGDTPLEAGDAVAIRGLEDLAIEATQASELLLFDLP